MASSFFAFSASTLGLPNGMITKHLICFPFQKDATPSMLTASKYSIQSNYKSFTSPPTREISVWGDLASRHKRGSVKTLRQAQCIACPVWHLKRNDHPQPRSMPGYSGMVNTKIQRSKPKVKIQFSSLSRWEYHNGPYGVYVSGNLYRDCPSCLHLMTCRMQ